MTPAIFNSMKDNKCPKCGSDNIGTRPKHICIDCTHTFDTTPSSADEYPSLKNKNSPKFAWIYFDSCQKHNEHMSSKVFDDLAEAEKQFANRPQSADTNTETGERIAGENLLYDVDRLTRTASLLESERHIIRNAINKIESQQRKLENTPLTEEDLIAIGRVSCNVNGIPFQYPNDGIRLVNTLREAGFDVVKT